jgi:hypothetical protein
VRVCSDVCIEATLSRPRPAGKARSFSVR